MFRYKKSINVGYDRQGYIYFTSRAYGSLSPDRQQSIWNLCLCCGGENYKALFQFVTTGAGAETICLQNNLSRSTLERAVRRYYKEFPDYL